MALLCCMTDPDIYARQGFGRSLGPPGPAALLVIDFVNGFTDASSFGGGNIAAAIEATRVLLARARAARRPVAFSRIVYPEGGPPAVFQQKVPSLAKLVVGSPLIGIVPDLTPEPGELVLDKAAPSMFFATNLAPWLVSQRVDSLLITGCTTSGCVRATVVDAMSFNYRCYVVEDCVGDRSFPAHRASLFDMAQKYADVIDLSRAMEVIGVA